MPGYLIDTSVWVAFAFPRHPGHAAFSEAFARISVAQPAVMCRAAEQGFMRLATTATVFKYYGVPDMNNQLALAMLDALRSMPHVRYSDEPPGMVAHWRQLAALPTASPKVWMDAYLAAFAISAGLSLVTLDKDFMAFAKHGLNCDLLAS